MTAWSYPLGLFDAFGVELEYMIVDRETLDVRPVCDALFRAVTGGDTSDVEPDGAGGTVSWSNELALHVVELKTQTPAPGLHGLSTEFQRHVNIIDEALAPLGCRLLPTGMHPWMRPEAETRLWPHEYTEVYRAYDRIFGCRGHGWGNLQSTHLNLPFANDEEFGRLHAAIRLVLPLLPALAASSPVVDGVRSASADQRLEVYRRNSSRVPLMTGLVVPEPVFTREAYERDILGQLYTQLAPLDPDGVLRHEFANARGAIARFDRGAIEIRVLDIQECPEADIAILSLIVATLRAVVSERWQPYAQQCEVPTEALHRVFLATVKDAERAEIDAPEVLAAFGMPGPSATAAEVWKAMMDHVMLDQTAWAPILSRLLRAGTLATRIRGSLTATPSPDELRRVYTEVADCLRHGTLFRVP